MDTAKMVIGSSKNLDNLIDLAFENMDCRGFDGVVHYFSFRDDSTLAIAPDFIRAFGWDDKDALETFNNQYDEGI
jgi:hypothetical protein